MKEAEETYKNLLSKDYDLLYSFAEKKQPVICFEEAHLGSTAYRRMTIAISVVEFTTCYLAFIEDAENKKELYLEYCTKQKLTFINPNKI